eukprot:TRINITY_DN97507_c1_g3_i1.p1 TRINITY_DN97507_c1_g3~~TRINITY_DN97507_c1_g3_i1.p1  ORF type:complete len:184 (+),score=90.08 TRINITY_DN97507_c1_g3_i1:240-791(+)
MNQNRMNGKKLQKMKGQVRIGGKGRPRRKRKARVKKSSGDEKRLQGQLRKMGCNTIPNIDEVRLYRNDQSCIYFSNPKLQAQAQANTFVVSGKAEEKTSEENMQDLIRTLQAQGLGGLGQGGFDQEKLEQIQKLAAAQGMGLDDDDDDVPDLQGDDDDDVPDLKEDDNDDVPDLKEDDKEEEK